MKRWSEKKWEEIGLEILDKVLGAVDYWCSSVSGDSLEECYAAHIDMDLYTLAEMYAGSSSGITERDLRLLAAMPESVYRKINAKLTAELERVVAELRGLEEEL